MLSPSIERIWKGFTRSASGIMDGESARQDDIESSIQDPLLSSSQSKQSRNFWLVRKIRHHYQSTIAKVPPKYKWLCLFLWVAWKFVAVYLVYYLIGPAVTPSTTIQWIPLTLPHQGRPEMVDGRSILQKDQHTSSPVRVLYIVTSTVSSAHEASSAVYNAVPLMRHSVATILDQTGFHVDIVWIIETQTGASVSDQVDITPFLPFIRKALPSQVGISIWPNASPLIPDPHTGRLAPQNSQQHQAWWAIRDKFPFYHFFMVWPDTARILGSHVSHFWTLSQQLENHSSYTDGHGNLGKNPPQKYIPAFVPVFPHAHIPTPNRTEHSSPESLHRTEHDNVHLWSPQSRLSWSPNQMTLGPSIQFPIQQNKTREAILRSSPTLLVPTNKLHPRTGFIISRSQLADHGLMECLFPSFRDAIPVMYSSSRNASKLLANACQMPGPSLLLTTELEKHFVYFVHPYDSKILEEGPDRQINSTTYTVDGFVQRVETFTKESIMGRNRTKVLQTKLMPSQETSVA